MTIFQRIMDIQSETQGEMLLKRNVVGVAAGYKETNGVITDEPAMVVMVDAKKSVTTLSPDDMVPREVGGVRTDVYEVGELRAQVVATDRLRPTIPGGASIGHFAVTAGTLGVIVRDRTTHERMILSNNHVLANTNNAQKGDFILQPGILDGGQNPADMVARLERFITLKYIEEVAAPTPTPDDPKPPLSEPQGCLTMLSALSKLFGGKELTPAKVQNATASAVPGAPTMPAPTVTAQAAAQTVGKIPINLVDCALARPIDPTMFNDQIIGIGVVRNFKAPQLGMQVRKSGRTTGLTEGVITLINATVDVGYGTKTQPLTARFTGQVICEPISKGGDSGALMVDAGNNAVGLLFAGSLLATIFTPIETVFNALNVELG
jgi:hypothetical protein